MIEDDQRYWTTVGQCADTSLLVSLDNIVKELITHMPNEAGVTSGAATAVAEAPHVLLLMHCLQSTVSYF